jgi:putative oxidoreductase
MRIRRQGEIESMDWLVNDGLPLVARICLVVLFPFSGLDKIVNWDSALKQAGSSFLPGAPVLLVLAMIVEFVTPVCVVSGWYDGLAAFVLAGYCVITAILYHNFWAYPRFWSPGSTGYPHIWDFLKNFGLVGGLLLIVLGSDLVAQVEHAAKEISASEIVHVQAD